MAKQAASRMSFSTPRKKRTQTVEGSRIPVPTHEDIACRAFELYLTRAGTGGDETSDWLRAEGELRSPQA